VVTAPGFAVRCETTSSISRGATSVVEQLREVVAAVPDPEIPVLTIDDLGILRDVSEDAGRLTITLTPTYSGCPAIDPIRDAVAGAAADAGFGDVEVVLQLKPAWTTAWMTDGGRRKLAAYGIAPPSDRAIGCPLTRVSVACPRCGSEATRLVTRFGATPCQAQYVCGDCHEPFDHFKAH
jgi:ring-1,2-phenylacetyl-CoA epoxidase subunit PaaD